MRALRALLVALLALVPLALSAQRPRVADGNAVRIVRVLAPADTGAWEYQVTLGPDVRALSPVAGRTLGARTPLAVTLQLGSQLIAGRQTVGMVTFSRGTERVESPLVVEVAATQAIALHAAASLAMARAGDDIALLFTLRNEGNASDTLTLVLDTPGGWSAAVVGVRTLTLAPGASALVNVQVTPPTGLAAGGTLVQLRAVGRTTVAQAQTTIEIGATRAQDAGEALRVNGSLSYLGGSNDLARNIVSLSLAGPLAKGIDISGELVSPINQRDAVTVRGASTVGLPVAGSHLRFSGSRGSVEFGRVSLRLPELAGRAVGGDGVAFSLRGPGVLGAAVVSDEAGAFTQGALTWAGGRGPVTVEAAAVRLRSGSMGVRDQRSLDALAVGARVQVSNSTSMGFELADRNSVAGHDIGVAADLAWQGAAGRAAVRVQHAPGGAAALALARDAVSAESMLRVSERWSVSGHTWFARDGDTRQTSLASAGGAINPSRRIGSNGEIGLLLSTTGFSSENEGTQQSSIDTEIGLRAAGLLRSVRWELEGTTRAQERLTRVQAVSLSERAERLSVRSGLTMPSRYGTLAARGGFAAANATQASEASFELQAAELRPIRALPWLSLEGTLQRAYLGRAAMDHARLSARAMLPGDLTLQLGVERESWSGTQIMPARSTVALRVTRAARVATADRWRSRTGVVFEDLDDDGVRDAGEPAVAGVTLRSGAQVVTSDREGKFRLAVDEAVPEIDVRTLRADQRPGSPTPADRWAIPVRTVGRLAVSVRRVAATADAGMPARTATIVVSARNAVGAEWRATVARDGLARFDALPIGIYTITAAAVEAAVTLRVETSTVRVERGSGLPGAEVPRFELLERDRPVRLQGGNAGLGVNAILGTQNTISFRQQQEQKQQEQKQQEQKQQELKQQELKQQELKQQEQHELEQGSR
jgi:hypothetical protein